MTGRWRAVLVVLALLVASTAISATSAASALPPRAPGLLDLDAFLHGADLTTPLPRAAGPSNASALHCPGGDSWEYTARAQTIGVDVEVYCSDSRGKGVVIPPAPGVNYRGYLYATMATGNTYDDVGLLDNLHESEFNGHKAADHTYVLGGVFDVRYCSLPGGSDLPGAVFRAKVVVDEPAHFDITDQYTLPDDKAPPVLSGGSTPPHGTKVHPGEVIKVHITATEPADRGPQEGIQDIQLLGPDGLVDSAQYGNHPKACDLSRLTKTFTTTYTVPNDPPPVIRLTAVAHDFANNESATLSADFPTGDVWTGTAHIVSHFTYPPALHECPATEIDDYTFNLVVGAEGAVQGTDTKLAKVTSCGRTTTLSLRFPVSGQLTDTEFHFTDLYFVTVVPLSSSKTMATAQLRGGSTTNPNTGAWTGTIKLTEA